MFLGCMKKVSLVCYHLTDNPNTQMNINDKILKNKNLSSEGCIDNQNKECNLFTIHSR